jgi:hypothetical protein
VLFLKIFVMGKNIFLLSLSLSLSLSLRLSKIALNVGERNDVYSESKQPLHQLA